MIIFANLLWYHWLLIVVGALVASMILFSIWLVFAISRRVYLHTLSKKMSEGGWKRECSSPNNPEQMKMWNDGIEYMSQFQKQKTDICIENDGLKLYGEFYNFGNKKTVLFL